MSKHILSVDCGSQSIRAMIFDDEGNLLAMTKEAFEPYSTPQPGWAEQDSDMYYTTMCRVIKKLKDEQPELVAKVQGLTLTTQRDSCVFLGEDNKPVRPMILWMDQRRLVAPKFMGVMHTAVLKLIGMYKTGVDVNKATPAHWVQQYQPEIWEKTKKYVLLSSYLNLKFTGKLLDNSANQVGHIPFNYKDGVWEKPWAFKAKFFQIPEEKLVKLTPPGEVLGKLSAQAAEDCGLPEGLSFISAGSDKGCETLGVGCLDETGAAVSLGSQATIQITSKRYFETLAFVPPFPSVVPGRYNPEIQIYRGYWMISWFKKQFALREQTQAGELGISPEELLNKNLAKVPPGCEGLILHPFWGSGIKTPEARGAIVGFSDVHTRAHIYRAIIEGIGFALYESKLLIEKKSKVKMNRVMLSGGGSQADEICQITADIFDLPVGRVQTHETSGLGAAMVGFCALGTIPSFEEAVKKMVHIKSFVRPDKDNVSIYHHVYNRYYKSIYKRLKPIYSRMHEDTVQKSHDEQSK